MNKHVHPLFRVTKDIFSWRLVGELGGQFEESSRLEKAIRYNLEALGYGE